MGHRWFYTEIAMVPGRERVSRCIQNSERESDARQILSIGIDACGGQDYLTCAYPVMLRVFVEMKAKPKAVGRF